MSVKVMGAVWDIKLAPAKRLVLLAMADHSDHQGKNVYPSIPLIAWKTGYSERQVTRIMHDLVKDKLLIEEKPARNHSSAVYRIEFPDSFKRPPYKASRGDKMSSLADDGRDDKMSPRRGDKRDIIRDDKMSPKPSVLEPSINRQQESLSNESVQSADAIATAQSDPLGDDIDSTLKRPDPLVALNVELAKHLEEKPKKNPPKVPAKAPPEFPPLEIPDGMVGLILAGNGVVQHLARIGEIKPICGFKPCNHPRLAELPAERAKPVCEACQQIALKPDELEQKKSASKSEGKPESAITKAIYEAMPEDKRPLRCDYAKQSFSAKVLYKANFTPEQCADVARYLWETDKWHHEQGNPVNTGVVERKIRALMPKVVAWKQGKAYIAPPPIGAGVVQHPNYDEMTDDEVIAYQEKLYGLSATSTKAKVG